MINIKEQILQYFITNNRKTLSKGKLEAELLIKPYERRLFEASLKELIGEKILVTTRKKKIMIKHNLELIIGKLHYNPKGYAFVVPFEEKTQALFVLQDNMGNSLNDDIVVARIIKKEGNNRKAEGEVLSILKREIDVVIGTYIASEKFGFVIPDNQRINKHIYIPEGSAGDANSYDKVVCQITRYPEKNRKPEGEIIEVIGLKGEKGVDVLSVIKENNLRTEFSDKALKQLEKISEVIPEIEFKRRRDLRDLTIFTIDGEDAKDLDDAVSIEVLGNGNYELGVHIADVSHYVKENTRLDKEALERGTSVYLVDTVIPMLPPKLSNNLCSLNPNTDKLTLSVFMEIDKNGFVVKHSIYESVICSRAKLNYTEVSNFLEKDDPLFKEKYPFLLEDLKIMEQLAQLLSEKRSKRGAIEFNFPESKIVLDKNGKVADVTKYDRRVANNLIEEFMLVCNETVAEHFYNLKIPFVYRVHEVPRLEKLKEFNMFIKNYGYILPEDLEKVQPKDLQQILKQTKGKPEEQAFHLLMLRSLQQARYAPVSKGHFGLATKFYSHFTSPIRRYPDLQIHRIIKEQINGILTGSRLEALEKIVEENSKMCSRRERIAQQAEIELHDIKKLEFMKDKVGQTFIGLITGMTTTGMFITLDNTVEGFLRVDAIGDDFYEMDKEQYAFIGQKTERKITLGDKLEIIVQRVNLDTKELVFSVKTQ